MADLFSDLPSWLPAEEWSDFVQMRKAKGKRAPWTPAAQKYILRELDRLRGQGHNVAEVLAQSVMNGWSGVFGVKTHQQALDQAKPVLTGGLAHRPAAEVLGDRLDPESIRAAALANRERIEAAKRGLLQ